MNITEKDIRFIVNARLYNRNLRKLLIWMGLIIGSAILFSTMGLTALAVIAVLIGSVAYLIIIAKSERELKQAAAEMYRKAKAEGVKVE